VLNRIKWYDIRSTIALYTSKHIYFAKACSFLQTVRTYLFYFFFSGKLIKIQRLVMFLYTIMKSHRIRSNAVCSQFKMLWLQTTG